MNSLSSCKTLLRGMVFDNSAKKIEVQYSTNSLKLDKVLLLNKLSRLEIESFSLPDLNEHELEKNIRKRGIDYDTLLKHHKVNADFRKKVQASFEKLGVAVKCVNRLNCSHSDIDWCDVVFPIGGDGTFLHTARYVTNRDKPVIGFNSDPSKSEGFLCLPKKCSSDIPKTLKKLIEGKFKWMYRTRIRVSFNGICTQQPPIELHEVKAHSCNLTDIVGEEKAAIKSQKPKEINQKLPVLALNEVFVSEIFTAKVSYFEMRLNNSEQSVKIKSSGLCVCTGTGSTAWNLSINRPSSLYVSNILKLYIKETGKTEDNFEHLVSNVLKNFNNKLKFEPEKQIMGYTIRELISLRVWPHPKGLVEPHGFANTIEVKSNCLDAGLILDGGISFPFNEGAVAFLETRPEDALKTVATLD